MVNITVASRLTLIYLAVGVAVAIGCAIGWYALAEQDSAINEIAASNNAGRFLQNADMMHDSIQSEVLATVAEGKGPGESANARNKAYAHDIAAFTEAVDQLTELPLPVEVRDRIKTLRPMVDAYIKAASAVIDASATSQEEAKRQLPQFTTLFESLLEKFEELTTLLSSYVAESQQHALARNHNAKRYLVAGFSGAVALAVLLTLITGSVRKSLNSLGRIITVSHEIMAGNLNARCDMKTHDEIGELGQAIDSMANKLHNTIITLRSEAESDAFRSKLLAALEMADTEEHTYQTVAHAMREISSEYAMELLLSDSSRSHLLRAVEHPVCGAPGCQVQSPFECVAVRRGNLTTFDNSDSLDACRHLRERVSGPVSGVCVPINFMGRSLGVLHTTGPVGRLPAKLTLGQLENLAVQASARIGTVRAFAQSQTQAATDSLTGLVNRRTAEKAVRLMIQNHRPYSLVLVDLDHFKRLNDTHGHAAGDAALRRFAAIVKGCLRERDLAARWGGEEFVILLPEATGAQAMDVCIRIQDSLAVTACSGSVPAFSASFGVIESDPLYTFEQQLRAADRALYVSKSGGRNRATLGQLNGSSDVASGHYDLNRDLNLPALADEA